MTDTKFNWDQMAVMIEREGEVYESAVRQAAQWLAEREVPVRRVLDVGSGPGVATCVWAEVFPEAEVVAVDGSAALLERARTRADRLGVTIGTLHAELPEGFTELGEADLIWTSQAMHHLGDQQGALTALAKLLRPGGVLAVAEGGLPARYLPRDIGIGRPGLLTRIAAATDLWFTRMRVELPSHSAEVEDWQGMLAAAGLGSGATRSFLVDLPAPVDTKVREHLRDWLDRVHHKIADGLLDEEDQAVVARLLDPEDPAGLMRRPDVFLLAARTVYAARKD
ncbi:class I SAM-dependent methyltransferase [Kutzneria albida]|uniref:Methyltransferase domain-containing protein n=1 Tax=Kutzneria albida DSM 43870 TaxID=1449976 RepID=W5WAD3_9PSEU|nr:class I SAM-dependent methyltransferase [Kutzneria albida]AHH97695.1 hypothetical protein KALB_4333 [Kutzneria albida DSM 43870]